MENYEVVLQKTTDDVVAEKAKNLSLNINFNDGTIQVNGLITVLTILNKEVSKTMTHDLFSIRLAELENQPSNMTLTPKQLAKKSVFEALLNKVKTATSKAIVDLYAIENPE